MKTLAKKVFESLPYPKVVIVGGGFAGLSLVRKLANKPFKVTLVDKNNFHTFQPLLYQVATASLTPDSIAYPFRKMIGPMDNIIFRMTEVERVDWQAKMLHTSTGPISYDILVLATGSSTNFFGNKDMSSKAMQLKSVGQALDIRSDFLQHFERAVALSDLNQTEEQRKALHFTIVGGGPTGVEVAGALAEIKNKILISEYREVDPSLMDITVIDAGPRLLSGMSEISSTRARTYLEDLGVRVVLNTQVEGYDGQIVRLSDGQTIMTQTVIWAAGVKGNPLPGLKEEAYTTNGRLLVDEYNTIQGHEYVFALGDLAQMVTPEFPKGHPMMAQPAMQQADHFARNLLRLSARKQPIPFQYKDKGSMATIGRNRAVAEIGSLKLGGSLAWYVWMAIHILFLIGFRNRLAVLFNWAVKYFSYANTIRIIVRPFTRSSV
ncbi:MAG: NAD(P)/FAD-dependent oxidoreductase [Saprospiraceae bacterium]|nr:NAD(P)/FAD-dependent oxidoreductase [Saprospiraceae bacterium]